MDPKRLSRRYFMRMSVAMATGLAVAACAPKVVKETVVVEKEVEKIVKETVIVEGTPQVVEKVVKETVVVEKAVTAAPAPPEPVTLRVNGRTGDGDVLFSEARRLAFQEEFPHITIKNELFANAEYYQKIELMLASGTAGDCFFVWSVGYYRYAFKGLILELDDLLDAQGFDLGVFFSAVIDSLRFNGKLYALPNHAHPGYCDCFYNKTLLEEAGVELPPADGSWTYDDLVATAKAVTADTTGDGKIDQFGLKPEVRLVGLSEYARAWGTDWLSEDGAKCLVDTPKCREAITYMYDLFQTHKVAPTPAQQIDKMFETGKVAMFHGGIWGGAKQKTIGDRFEMGAAPMPKGPAGVRGTNLTVSMFPITKASKHPEEVLAWVKFLARKEQGLEAALVGEIPGARPDVWDDPQLTAKPMFKVSRLLMLDAMPWRPMVNFAYWEAFDTWGQGADSMWLGDTTPEEAIPEIASALQDVMDKPAE